MKKYKVIAYRLKGTWAKINNVWTLVHRWKRICSWDYETKSHALKMVRIWANPKAPFFKATLQSIKRGGQKRGKR